MQVAGEIMRTSPVSLYIANYELDADTRSASRPPVANTQLIRNRLVDVCIVYFMTIPAAMTQFKRQTAGVHSVPVSQPPYRE